MRKTLATLILFFVSNTAIAQQPDTIRFLTEHLPPFQIYDKGEVGGFTTEIIDTALKTTSLNYKFTVYPWTRAYNMAQKLKNTCIYSIARTPEREPLFKWLQVIAHSDSTFIGLSDDKHIKINSIEDAKRYKIAVIRDDATHQILLKKGFEEGVNLFVVNNTYSLLKLLVQRKGIDLILADIMTVQYRAAFDGLSPDLFKPYYKLNEKPLDFYLACSLSTPDETVSTINNALTELITSDQQQAIIQRWKRQALEKPKE
ncbi:substrate-binding periplasmic protein [Colwellia sp. MEBiC06753]